MDTAYAAVKTKINLDSPDSSRLVLRLREEFHNCWSDCAANATTMEDAIRAYAQQIPLTSVDPQLVISKALTMYDGTVASGGSRYEAGQIALWEFKEGSGTTAFDTSGVQPAINLTLSGDIRWVGGWGIDIRSGRAQGSTTASRKLRDLITRDRPVQHRSLGRTGQRQPGRHADRHLLRRLHAAQLHDGPDAVQLRLPPSQQHLRCQRLHRYCRPRTPMRTRRPRSSTS